LIEKFSREGKVSFRKLNEEEGKEAISFFDFLVLRGLISEGRRRNLLRSLGGLELKVKRKKFAEFQDTHYELRIKSEGPTPSYRSFPRDSEILEGRG
jgi:hypothetical protein